MAGVEASCSSNAKRARSQPSCRAQYGSPVIAPQVLPSRSTQASGRGAPSTTSMTSSNDGGSCGRAYSRPPKVSRTQPRRWNDASTWLVKATVAPIATDPEMTALQKLQGIFAGIAQWKSAQPELQPDAVTELVRTWYSDENSLVLERMRAAVATRLTPLLLAILRQGAADGLFALTSPEGTASVITSLILGLSEVATRLFLARRDGTVSFETVTCTLAAYYESFGRILGIPPTSWPLLDERTVRFWFG